MPPIARRVPPWNWFALVWMTSTWTTGRLASKDPWITVWPAVRPAVIPWIWEYEEVATTAKEIAVVPSRKPVGLFPLEVQQRGASSRSMNPDPSTRWAA